MIQYYYPRTIKGIIVALSDVFNEMVVYKYNAGTTSAGYGTSAQEYPVFFSFGPMEKEHLQRIEDHEYHQTSAVDLSGYTQVQVQGQRYYPQLPRMALVWNGLAYNADRAYGVNEWREWFQETLELSGSQVENILRDYQPTPWDFNFTLYIETDSLDYFSQIMENILPYFNPALQLRVKEFSFLNIERNLKTITNGVVPEFVSNDIPDDDRRYVNGTMDITVEGYMYRPFEYSGIIKSIHSKYFVVDASNAGGVSALSAGTLPSVETILSADYYDTSGAKLTSAGDYPTSAIPDSYSFSGTYVDGTKDFAYWTSATNII
jgi:hypothetical protein